MDYEKIPFPEDEKDISYAPNFSKEKNTFRAKKIVNPAKDKTTGSCVGGLINHPILSQEEEIALGKLSIQGDEAAIQKLTEYNLRLVVHIAKHFVTSRNTLGDCISIGTIGLIRAAKRFDPDKGCKFSTYATWWIRDSLLKAYWKQKSSIVHVPTYIAALERRLRAGETLLPREIEYVRQAEYARIAHSDVYSLPPEKDLRVEEEEEGPLDELVELMMGKLEHLTQYDQYILKARFGLPPNTRKMTLSEIGKVEGISQERVRQIEQRAIERLRALVMENQVQSTPDSE